MQRKGQNRYTHNLSFSWFTLRKKPKQIPDKNKAKSNLYCLLKRHWFLGVFIYGPSLKKRKAAINRELTSVSRSEEESVDEIGEPVSKVLKECEPLRSRFLTSPTLTFSGCSPNGHPSSCTYPYSIFNIQQMEKTSKPQNTHTMCETIKLPTNTVCENIKIPILSACVCVEGAYLLSHCFLGLGPSEELKGIFLARWKRKIIRGSLHFILRNIGEDNLRGRRNKKCLFLCTVAFSSP